MLLLVLCVVGGGGGVDATPAVGISPANAEPDRTHVRINAKVSRFILSFSCSRVTRLLASANMTITKDSLQGNGLANYYPVAVTFPPVHSKGFLSNEDDSGEAGFLAPYAQ
jgi:hypothetical protein